MVRDVSEALHVLSQIISAFSCEQNWSAHGHIHSKIGNRLEPATTEKLVHVYSNSKMVAATSYANELRMLAWAVHLMKVQRSIVTVTASDLAALGPAGRSQPG